MIQVQIVLGYSPLLAGIAYLPYGAGILAGMWLSSRISFRVGTRWALLLAFLVDIAGLLLLSGVAAGDSYAAHVLRGMLILSVGNGLSLPFMAVAAVDGTTEQDAGLGSALFTSVQQVGGAVRVAALAIMGPAFRRFLGHRGACTSRMEAVSGKESAASACSRHFRARMPAAADRPSPRAQIRTLLDFSECTVADAERLTQWLVQQVYERERRADRVREALPAQLREERVERPTRLRLSQMIGSALSHSERVQTPSPRSARSRATSA